jgi:phospholipid/cholesterol/gamma-HCH transport system ATP-binding protein
MAAVGSELLACRDLACGYDAREPVLKNVQLAVQPGEILTILGGSGSGKSTLLRTLAGLQPPLAGSVSLLGEDPYALDALERRRVMRRTGMLFQHDALFGSLPVLDNIALPVLELTRIPEALAHEMSRAKLALVDLSEFERRLPSELSGGQRKRVALARATVLDPLVLFVDEPTSGLDPATASRIDQTLLRFRDVLRVAIVAVTHDVEGVRAIADRAVVVDRGGICAEGTIDVLEQSDQPAVYEFFHRRAVERKPDTEPTHAGQP